MFFMRGSAGFTSTLAKMRGLTVFGIWLSGRRKDAERRRMPNAERRRTPSSPFSLSFLQATHCRRCPPLKLGFICISWHEEPVPSLLSPFTIIQIAKMNNSISAYDSSLFRNIFTTDRMRAEFSESAWTLGSCIISL